MCEGSLYNSYGWFAWARRYLPPNIRIAPPALIDTPIHSYRGQGLSPVLALLRRMAVIKKASRHLSTVVVPKICAHQILTIACTLSSEA